MRKHAHFLVCVRTMSRNFSGSTKRDQIAGVSHHASRIQISILWSEWQKPQRHSVANIGVVTFQTPIQSKLAGLGYIELMLIPSKHAVG